MTITTTGTATATTASQQAAAARADTFTLTFPQERIALLEVRGASSQEEARIIASAAFSNCRYEVADGDQANGHAAIFYQWCSVAAQECQPLHQPQHREAQV